jgi:tetratricopeptide (TPR) repeat protein
VEEAVRVAGETIQLDIADFAAFNERYLLHISRGEDERAAEVRSELLRLMRNDVHNYITLATDYSRRGLYEEARDVLQRLIGDGLDNGYPMVHYYLGYFYEKLKSADLAQAYRQAGSAASADYCFPNSLDDLFVLESAIAANAGDAKAHYYLGNLLYDKKRRFDAIRHWEASREADDTFATVHRNLALAYYNTLGKAEQARISLEKAFACNSLDARVWYELDQLYKKAGIASANRLANLESYWELVVTRDDLYLEYITLLNTLKQHEKAIALLSGHIFHPWEGGEGKVTGQYVFAHVELGKQYLFAQQGKEAVEMLQKALIYPENLGEGKLAGAQENNIHYYLGCAYESLSSYTAATDYFQMASSGLEDPTSAMFYNDQPPDMIFYQGLAWLKSGDEKQANRHFNKLIDYGERHLFDKVKIDYFAVSLPDFLVFEDDLKRRNAVHCHYMMGLGYFGLQEREKARKHLSEVLKMDVNHQGARVHLEMCR